MPDLNEEVTYTVDESTMLSVPVDATLSISGQAADAYAVGQALDEKLDIDDFQVSVNGVQADNQGAIIITGADVPVSGTDTRKIHVAIAALEGKTGEDIPVNSETGADSIADAIDAAKTTIDATLTQAGEAADAKAAGDAIAELELALAAYVKSVDSITPDSNGNVTLTGYAKSVEGITPGATGDISLATLIATSTEVQAMIADVLAGTTSGTARTDAYISALMLRTALALYHAALPTLYPQRKIISVTIPANTASYTVDDSWISADTDCYTHNLGTLNADPDTSVGWSFTAGHVTFTLGEALESPLTFSFGMIKGGIT